MNNITSGVDPNYRTDPFLHNVRPLRHPTVERVSSLALPFLGLYAPTRNALTVGLGAVKSWRILTNIAQDCQNRQWGQMKTDMMHLGICVSSVALNILLPVVSATFSSVTLIITDSRQMYLHVRNGEWQAASLKLLAIINHTIYLGSVVFASTELILLSLVAQAVKELYLSYREFQRDGRKPECLANLLMAIIRVSQASTHAQTVHRNYFGKKMTQDDLAIVIEEIQRKKAENPEKTVEFEKILVERNFSSKIQKISFTAMNPKGQEGSCLTPLSFKNQSFTDCDFSSQDLNGFVFENVSINRCNFQNSSFVHSTFINSHSLNSNFIFTDFAFSKIYSSSWTDCSLYNSNFYGSLFMDNKFQNCDFTETNISNAYLQNTRFEGCDLSYTSFNGAQLDHVLLDKSKLLATCFLEAVPLNSKIKDCDLTDTLFVDAKEHFEISGGAPHVITRPVIGILWDFKGQGRMTEGTYLSLKDCDAIPLRFEQKVKGVTAEALHTETLFALDAIAKYGLPEDAISIPDAILKGAAPDSAIGRVKQRSEMISEHIQGLVLPGGLDVHPEFYGHQRDVKTYTDSDYQRSFVEFSMISSTYQKGIPIHGICRGSQIGNVFFGGTLKQHVEGHLGAVHNLTIKQGVDSKAASVIQEIIGDSTKGYSAHHQASDQIGKDLHTVIEFDNVPKAIVSRDGKVVLTQFHPEVYYYSKLRDANSPEPKGPNQYPYADNKNFFTALINKSKTYQEQSNW